MGVEDWGARCRVLRLRAGVMGWKEGEEASNDGETQRVFDKYIFFTVKVFTLEKRVRAGLGFWKDELVPRPWTEALSAFLGSKAEGGDTWLRGSASCCAPGLCHPPCSGDLVHHL